MNLWTDSERKWALESESDHEIEEKHLLHNVMSYKVLKTIFPQEANKLFSCGQGLQLY